MSKRTPRYMRPTTSSATRNSITDEEIRQRKHNSNKGRTSDRSPTYASSSGKILSYEEKNQKRLAKERPKAFNLDDQHNRRHQYKKTTDKYSSGDWNSHISDQIDREYPSGSGLLESPDENLKYPLIVQYEGRHHHVKSTLETPGDNLKFFLSDQKSRESTSSSLESPCDASFRDWNNRENLSRSSSLEWPDDDLDNLEPPCQQMPSTDYDFSNAFSRLSISSTRENRPSYTPRNLDRPLGIEDSSNAFSITGLSPTRDYELSHTTRDKGSTFDVKDYRSSHSTSGEGSTLGAKVIWLSDTTRGRTNFDVQVNENVGGHKFTEQNPDPYKTFFNDESSHRPISPVRREPLISGSSNGEDYSYTNTRDSATSASLLHDNHRSTSRTNIDLLISAPSVHNDSLPSTSSVQISDTSLEDDNLRSLSQTKTEIRRLLSYDAKDKDKKQEETPMHPHSKTKLRKPDSASIKTSNDSKEYEPSHITCDKGSTFGDKDNRSSHPTSGEGSTFGAKDNWLSDTTRGSTIFDVQINVEGLIFTERNRDASKHFVEGKSGHRPISPLKKEFLISGSSDGKDYSYRNTRNSATSASLHDHHRSMSRTNINLQISAPSVHDDSPRSPSSASKDLRISETSLQDDNLCSSSQSKTDFGRSLSYDGKDKAKNLETNPMHLHSQTKPRRPVSATINTYNDSKLQDDDDSAITSASLLHQNQRSPSSANKDSRISGTYLQDDNLRSPSQTKTDFRRSLSFDAMDKEKKHEKPPMHPHYTKKVQKPDSATIKTSNDSNLQDEDDSFSSLPDYVASSPLVAPKTAADNKKKSADLDLCDNLLFYQGKIKSKPAPGHTITEMLKWKGDYGMLERNHLYIQWLFPIHESSGLNRHAQALTDYEAEEIQKDKMAHERVLKSYKMMLDFYGMTLINERDGTLRRADNYIERYDNINRFRHNLLRITRIIKSMGELGYQRLQAPLVNFLYVECVIERKLPNFRQSTFDHWINAIYDDNERMKMYRLFHGFTDDVMENEFMATVTAEVRDIKNDEKDDIVGNASVNRTVNPSAHRSDVSKSIKTDSSVMYDEMRKKEPTLDKGNGEPTRTEHKRDKSKSEGKSEQVVTQEFQINSKDGRTLELPERTSQTVVSDHGARTKDRKSPTQTRRDSPLQTTQGRTDTDLAHVENKNHRLDELGAVDRSFEKAVDIDDTYQCDNLRFYRNEIQSRPSPGYTIETILQHCDDHSFLDNYPYFLKWLFPTPNSLDINTQPLLPHEIKAIQRDEKTSSRVFRAYVLVLNYYGIMIVNKHTGKLQKSKNWESRWKIINLNNEHELKHITRVLVSLGELGYERYQVPLIEFFIKNKDDIKEFEWNSIRHWIENVNDEEQQNTLFEKYGKKIFSDKALDAYNAQTKHEQQRSGYGNALDHLDIIWQH